MAEALATGNWGKSDQSDASHQICSRIRDGDELEGESSESRRRHVCSHEISAFFPQN